MTRLVWNPLGPTVTLGDKRVDLSFQQVRLMQELGARPGEMVTYQKLDPTGTGWHLEAHRRLLDRLRKAFGREIADRTLLKLPAMGLRWDGDAVREARIAPLLLTTRDGRPMNIATVARQAVREHAFKVTLEGKTQGHGLAVLTHSDGRFMVLTETDEGAAYMLRAGTGRAF